MENQSDKGTVEMRGVVNDGYLKMYPYGLSVGNEQWGLDVVSVPKEKIGKEVSVKARTTTVSGIAILTDVMIDGVRLQTKKEWQSANNGPDPFADGE